MDQNRLKQYDDFLRNGCFFALDSDRILIGWGEWLKTPLAPARGPHHCSLYTPDFYLSEPNPWRTPPQFEVMTREFFTTNVLPRSSSEVKEFRWVEPLPEEFEHQVKIIREAIENGSLEKAVPVVHAQACEIMTQDRLVKTLRAMVAAPASLISNGFWESRPGEDLTEGLLGATPERLFSIDRRGNLATMALAGTRAKTFSGGDDAKILFEDRKERREHQIVVDDLKSQLAKWGDVEVGETFVVELPTLFHLKTVLKVSGSKNLLLESAFNEVANALHPTPALGVSPRSLGFKAIKRWDDTGLRNRFGAPFGLRLKTGEHDIQDCLVAIRNVQWTNGLAPTLGSGCGFVRESILEREWAELKLKRDSVKKVLNL